jgi:outer membrane protein
MNKRIVVLFSIQAALFIALTCIVLFNNQNVEERTAYIEVAKVYDAFKMKKELENKFTNVEQFRKTILDSLELELQLMATSYEQDHSEEIRSSYLMKKQEYLGKKKQFDEDNAAVSQQYTTQILQQMNEYVTEYGKEHGYKYIFGAEGSGSLMYASDSENITDEITIYVNEKYSGVN